MPVATAFAAEIVKCPISNEGFAFFALFVKGESLGGAANWRQERLAEKPVNFHQELLEIVRGQREGMCGLKRIGNRKF